MALKDITFNNEGTELDRLKKAYLAIAELQTKVTALVTLANELKADKVTLLAKLDTDTGVAGTDYATTCATAAADVTI